jgi:TPR repeat protein
MKPLLSRRLAWMYVFTAVAAGLPAQDSAPVLLSRTAGGRKIWINLTELTAAAGRNVPEAWAQLGERLLSGDGVPPDVPRALDLLDRAARVGVGSAAFRLGMVLDDGELVAQDRRRALDYFRAAAAGGVTEAFHNAGAAYAGAHGVKRDYAEGLAWLILAVKRGADAESMHTVRERILILRHPEWIAAAEARAPAIEAELAAATLAALLPPAAPYGAAEAPSDAAPPGPPVKVVLPTGRYLSWASLAALEHAADRGEPGAQAALGQVLLEGRSTAADPARAVGLLERAALAGSADAAQLLAELCSKSEKIPRDDTRAFAFTLQAARGGSLLAMFNVGALYANGRGTARDYTASLQWLIVAKHYKFDQGGAEQRIRAQLAKITPAQIAVAEQRAAETVREIDRVLANPDRP